MDPSRRTPGDLSPHKVTSSVRAVRPLLGYLAARGHDRNELLRAEGVDPALLDEPEARLPHAVCVRLWEVAGELTGDPDLGLHVAEAIQPGDFGALEYVARTSSTLGAGVTRLFRYYRVLHDAVEVALETHEDRVVLSHRLPLPGGAPRPIAEFVMGCWFVGFRHAAGVDWTPLEVRFPHPEPGDTSEYRRLFRTSVHFGHTRSELVISKHLLDLPLVRADAALQSIVEEQVAAMLESLSSTEGEAISGRLRRLLTEELCDGEPTLDHLAARLHMSARTLHRRLGEEGTTFRRVVTEVRRDLAERHLREQQLAVSEIAFLLGFSEASAFHRAFKRWTGRPPLAYRQTIGAIGAVSPYARRTQEKARHS